MTLMGSLGRVVIPKEIREAAGFAEGDELAAEVRGKEVVLYRAKVVKA